jgi:peptide-methionine (S)-S-oxide reductase
VINYLHTVREANGQQPFDTVRGVFLEGDPIYANAGFRRETHIQICVRNLAMIKGVFRVPAPLFRCSAPGLKPKVRLEPGLTTLVPPRNTQAGRSSYPPRIVPASLGVQYPVTPQAPLTFALRLLTAVLALWLGLRFWRRKAMASSRKEPIPAPIHDIVAPESVFAGGCFWGVQSVFQRVKGVLQTTVGYSGGTAETATYRAVCAENTGHAEAIEIVYDPALVSYGTLLRIFFSVVHDPTQLNRQGADIGTSYRSAIFTTSDEQREIAQAYVHQLDAAHVFPRPIVTQIVPLEAFYPGEEYHQDYAVKNPHNPYIQVCDIPKIASLGEQFPALFQEYSR